MGLTIQQARAAHAKKIIQSRRKKLVIKKVTTPAGQPHKITQSAWSQFYKKEGDNIMTTDQELFDEMCQAHKKKIAGKRVKEINLEDEINEAMPPGYWTQAATQIGMDYLRQMNIKKKAAMQTAREDEENQQESSKDLYEDIKAWLRGKSTLKGKSAIAARTSKHTYKKMLDAASAGRKKKAKPAPKPKEKIYVSTDAKRKAFLARQLKRLQAAGKM
jgi:hypothetical protein